MNRKILAIGFAIAIALYIALVAIPVSAEAAEEFTGTAATAAEVTPAEEALEGIVIRVHFVDFTYTMPSGRNPGPLSDQWYITGTVTNEEGEIIAEERSGIYYIGDSGHFLDLEIWKDIPKKGDKVSITLGARTYALGYYIDINPEEVYLITPHNPAGRQVTTDYVIDTEQEGWGIGGTGWFSVKTDLNGNLHYKIETIGLEEPEQPKTAKGCIQYPAYPPCTPAQCTIPEDMVAVGMDLDLECRVVNCGEGGGNIEARVYNANSGETLAANRSYCEVGDMVIARTTLKTTIEDARNPIVLGYQALHWDIEQAEWIMDEGRFEKIIVMPIPIPTPTPMPVIFTAVVTPTVTATTTPTATPTPVLTPAPPLAATPTAIPATTQRKQSITEIFADWLAWLKELL